MGFVQGGTVIHDGESLAIQGVKPSGIAAQGQVIWRSSAWQLLANASITTPAVNTPSLDTTGATLLIAVGVMYQVGLSVSDSQSNVWTEGVIAGPSGLGATISQIWYSLNPIISTAHVFSWPTASYSSMLILAFKGPANIVVDQNSSLSSSAQPTTIQANPLTPSQPNSLVIAALAVNGIAGQTVPTIDSGFTIGASVVNPASGNNMGAAAYLVQGSVAQLTPTWSWTAANLGIGATMLNFIEAPWQLLASTAMIAPLTTSAPLDTTGANLIVVVGVGSAVAGSLSDSQNNVWTAGAGPAGGSYSVSAIVYCINPVTSAAHTFSYNVPVSSIIVLAFRTPPLAVDQSSSSTFTSTPIQPPAVTPSTQQGLAISGIAPSGGSALTIDSGFTIAESITFVGGVAIGGAAAFLVYSGNAPLAPTWTSDSTSGGVTLLTFKPI